MDYRRITAADIDEVSLLGLRGLALAGELPLHVDLGKIRSAVTLFAEDRGAHFQMAAFEHGKPVAALAAYVAELPFHERCEATVVMCFSTSAGAGFKLLREMVAWFKADFRLRRITWAMNEGFDKRLRYHARRLGFKSEAPMFILYK